MKAFCQLSPLHDSSVSSWQIASSREWKTELVANGCTMCSSYRSVSLLHLCVCLCVCCPLHGHRRWERALDPLDLEWQAFVSHLTWMMGPGFWSSRWSASALKHRAISPALLLHSRFNPLQSVILFSILLLPRMSLRVVPVNHPPFWHTGHGTFCL